MEGGSDFPAFKDIVTFGSLSFYSTLPLPGKVEVKLLLTLKKLRLFAVLLFSSLLNVVVWFFGIRAGRMSNHKFVLLK